MVAVTRLHRGNRPPVSIAAGSVALLAVIALAGCDINVHHDGKGQDKNVDIESPLGAVHVNGQGPNKNVDIESPFGGVHVRTDGDAAKDTGIAVYPGARPKKDNDSDHSSANINIASSMFGLKVVAAGFETDDPPEKVLEFYRKQLKAYGSVLECTGSEMHVAKPGESRELACADTNKDANVDVLGDHAVRLKVGTTDRQHVVEVKPHGSGTEFGLVYVQTRGKGESI